MDTFNLKIFKQYEIFNTFGIILVKYQALIFK